MLIFRCTPIKKGHHVEVYSKTSKNYGKRGTVEKVSGRNINIREDETGEPFTCYAVTIRRTMDLSTLMPSEFVDKLEDHPDLYEAYRNFSGLLNRYYVNPTKKEFTDIIVAGMLV
jgi:hypothetical protein